uniref:Transposase n=1 Tax=Rhabditophanes sp. KR3021 TaxID=114890 RepID=A0AC35THV0_9BILA
MFCEDIDIQAHYLTCHVKKRKLRAEIDENFKKERQLSGVELLEKVTGELKKAKTRKTAKGGQSIYILVDLPAGVDGGSASFNEYKNGIFYDGVSKNVKAILLDHISATRLYFRRFILLNDKETRFMDILDNKRQIVAFYCDELAGNEALAFEYAVTLDLQHVLTNIDASGQSND